MNSVKRALFPGKPKKDRNISSSPASPDQYTTKISNKVTIKTNKTSNEKQQPKTKYTVHMMFYKKNVEI